MYTEIEKCRICGNRNLKSIINLGNQKLTGVFPLEGECVPGAPLEVVKCEKKGKHDACGLVQLRYSCDITEMYGDNYGYRSGLNESMVAHLKDIVTNIKETVHLEQDDLIIDIGSNDCTLLKCYASPELSLDFVGIDPSGAKWLEFYPDNVTLISEFFTATCIKGIRKNKKAKVITSIAMFYDLEDPISFAKDVVELLHDDGVWVMEQSYLPAMLQSRAFDTICQEHLEFYSLKQIKWIADHVGLKIIKVDLNNTNGGSFRVTLAKNMSSMLVDSSVADVIELEKKWGG